MLTTIKRIEKEFINSKDGLFFSSVRALDDSGDFFLYAKEISNTQPNEPFSGLNLCFLHDFGEHSQRYLLLLSKFISSFSTPTRILLVDFKGHGKSSGTRGHIDSLDSICRDTIAFLNLWQAPHESKVAFISFGLGGIVALKIIHLFFSQLQFEVAGLVLLNPGLKWRWRVPSLLESVVSGGVKSLKKVKLPFQIEGSLFAGDSVIAQEFDADPLINHTMTWGTFLEVQKGASTTRTSAYYLDVPVFIGISENDQLYDHSVTELFARGIAECELIHYGQAFHDLLHYFEHEKVLKDVYNWMKDKKITQNPS